MNEFDRNPGIVPPVPPDDPPSDPAKPVSIHHGMVVRLRNYFLTGLVLVGPAYITISLIWCGPLFQLPIGRIPICR
jgi:hypothetical protein